MRDETGGVAEFVIARDRAAIKANAAWWLQHRPAYQQDYTDKWVKADDTMGFPVSALTGLSGDRLRDRLADRKADVEWTATPACSTTGHRRWRWPSAATPPTRTTPTTRLARLRHADRARPRCSASAGRYWRRWTGWPAPAGGRAYPDVQLATTRPGTECRDRPTRVDDTAPTIPDLPQPEVPGPRRAARAAGTGTRTGRGLHEPGVPVHRAADERRQRAGRRHRDDHLEQRGRR